MHSHVSKLGRSGNGANTEIAIASQTLDVKSQNKLQEAHRMSGYDPDIFFYNSVVSVKVARWAVNLKICSNNQNLSVEHSSFISLQSELVTLYSKYVE